MCEDSINWSLSEVRRAQDLFHRGKGGQPCFQVFLKDYWVENIATLGGYPTLPPKRAKQVEQQCSRTPDSDLVAFVHSEEGDLHRPYIRLIRMTLCRKHWRFVDLHTLTKTWSWGCGKFLVPMRGSLQFTTMFFPR